MLRPPRLSLGWVAGQQPIRQLTQPLRPLFVEPLGCRTRQRFTAPRTRLAVSEDPSPASPRARAKSANRKPNSRSGWRSSRSSSKTASASTPSAAPSES